MTEINPVEFWKWCGFKVDCLDEDDNTSEYWIYPDEGKHWDLPSLDDLNALFKWAVPALSSDGISTVYRVTFYHSDLISCNIELHREYPNAKKLPYFSKLAGFGRTYAEALVQAIWQVKEK